MKKTNKNANLGMALGMTFGISIGTALGSTFDNIALGTSLGLCIGMLIGRVLGAAKDNIINEQIKKEGYKIKEIKNNQENKDYMITIVNREGKQSIVTVPQGQMEAENFAIDDIIFLDEDGLLEQAYDKEDEQ